MRFLLDENVPLLLNAALIERGHEALHVGLIDPRAGDPSVLERARREERLLITFDSDFARMIYQEGETAPPGVVYMRSRPENPLLVVKRFLASLDTGLIELAGKFVVIDEGSAIRVLPLK